MARPGILGTRIVHHGPRHHYTTTLLHTNTTRPPHLNNLNTTTPLQHRLQGSHRGLPLITAPVPVPLLLLLLQPQVLPELLLLPLPLPLLLVIFNMGSFTQPFQPTATVATSYSASCLIIEYTNDESFQQELEEGQQS